MAQRTGMMQSIAGYAMGVAAVLVVLVTFVANDELAAAFMKLTRITVSPRYTGGDVVKIINRGPYRTFIHRPVFDGLISDRKTGFLQIDWKGEGPFPDTIEESLDIGRDNVVDTIVRFDTKTLNCTLPAKDPSVIGVDRTYRLDNGFAIRLGLRKTDSKSVINARP